MGYLAAHGVLAALKGTARCRRAGRFFREMVMTTLLLDAAGRGRDLPDHRQRHHLRCRTVGYIERADCSPSLELALRMAQLFALPVEAIFSLAPMPPLSVEVFREHRR